MVQFSHPYMTTGKIIALTLWTLFGKVMPLSLSLFNFLHFFGEGNYNPLQYSCLKNPMDGGAWQATFHGSQRVRHEWLHFTSAFLMEKKKKIQGQYKMKITFFYFYDFAYAFFFTSTIHYQNYFINRTTPLLLFKSQQACTSDEIFNGLTQQFTHSWEVFCGSRQLYGALFLWWHSVQGRTHWNNTSVSIINFTHSPLTRDSHMAPTNNKMTWSQKWPLLRI